MESVYRECGKIITYVFPDIAESREVSEIEAVKPLCYV